MIVSIDTWNKYEVGGPIPIHRSYIHVLVEELMLGI